MLMATSVIAQNNTNALPPIPAPLIAPPTEAAPVVAPTVEPVKKAEPAKPKAKKRAVAPKKPLAEPTITLLPGTAEVTVSNLNVRGKAGLQGEVIEKLNKGDVVTVLSQVNLQKHSVGEPAQWAKILLPSSTKLWVNSSFISPVNKTVVPKKLNLRAGPGENYSVLGTIGRGTAVNETKRLGSWMQIEPLTNAYGFVAAMYL